MTESSFAICSSNTFLITCVGQKEPPIDKLYLEFANGKGVVNKHIQSNMGPYAVTDGNQSTQSPLGHLKFHQVVSSENLEGRYGNSGPSQHGTIIMKPMAGNKKNHWLSSVAETDAQKYEISWSVGFSSPMPIPCVCFVSFQNSLNKRMAYIRHYQTLGEHETKRNAQDPTQSAIVRSVWTAVASDQGQFFSVWGVQRYGAGVAPILFAVFLFFNSWSTNIYVFLLECKALFFSLEGLVK